MDREELQETKHQKRIPIFCSIFIYTPCS